MFIPSFNARCKKYLMKTQFEKNKELMVQLSCFSVCEWEVSDRRRSSFRKVCPIDKQVVAAVIIRPREIEEKITEVKPWYLSFSTRWRISLLFSLSFRGRKSDQKEKHSVTIAGPRLYTRNHRAHVYNSYVCTFSCLRKRENFPTQSTRECWILKTPQTKGNIIVKKQFLHYPTRLDLV